MEEIYYQCRLWKKIPQGHEEQVAWIESRGAHKGAVLELKMDDGSKDPGWEVVAVSGTPASKEAVQSMRDAYRHQRKASDI